MKKDSSQGGGGGAHPLHPLPRSAPTFDLVCYYKLLPILLKVHVYFNATIRYVFSGLDASSSLELLTHLNLVAESGRLVILTIHQPRLEIFHLFHKIILLYEGQVNDCTNIHLSTWCFIQRSINLGETLFRITRELKAVQT